ncbi:MAG: glycosyltransferase family 4 protein [Opitutaceae bacterium]|nr:glycosyltransferase family 4 protein [Opitutaceae bacterium]
MRIAFVSTILNFPWGGADTLWNRAAETALERGDSICLALSASTAGHPRVQALVAGGAQLIIRPSLTKPLSFPARVWRRLRVREGGAMVTSLAEFRPDLVIVSCGGTYDLTIEPALVGWLSRTKTRLRVIANWQHENPSLTDIDRTAISGVFQRADVLFFVSTRNLAVTRRHLLDPLPHSRVIHNPLRCGSGSELPWPDESTWRMATVSRLEHTKGVALLLHTLAATLGNEPGWRLEIFGRGPGEEYLRAVIASLRFDERVQLRGHVTTLPEIWAHNHLLVSPALEEGVPMTIPEAMMCGRPVLATCVGGAEDWVRDGETGYLCAAPTLPLLACCVRAAWQQRTRWHELGRRAVLDAVSHYRPDDYLQLIA